MIEVRMLMRMKKKMMKTTSHRQDTSRSTTPRPFKKRKVSEVESVLISEAASVLAER
jgi:hypothetical protein